MSKLIKYINSIIKECIEEENVSANVAITSEPLVVKKPSSVDEVTGAVKQNGGKRFIPLLLPPIPAELRGEHFRIVKGADGGLKLYVSPYVKLGLDQIERGRTTMEKEFKEKTSLTRYISEKLPAQTRGAIKKGLDGSKLVNFGGKQMILCNVELVNENGEYYVKNPYFDKQGKEEPKPKKAADLFSDEELSKFLEGTDSLMEGVYGQFKSDVKNRTKTEQLQKAIRHVKKKLQEINRIVEYTAGIKNELSENEGGVQLYKGTSKNIAEISSMMESLNEKIKNLQS